MFTIVDTGGHWLTKLIDYIIEKEIDFGDKPRVLEKCPLGLQECGQPIVHDMTIESNYMDRNIYAKLYHCDAGHKFTVRFGNEFSPESSKIFITRRIGSV